MHYSSQFCIIHRSKVSQIRCDSLAVVHNIQVNITSYDLKQSKEYRNFLKSEGDKIGM